MKAEPLILTDEDGFHLKLKEVFGLGDRMALAWAEDDDGGTGVNLTVPQLRELRAWINRFIGEDQN